jgi:hypothetical protein
MHKIKLIWFHREVEKIDRSLAKNLSVTASGVHALYPLLKGPDDDFRPVPTNELAKRSGK